MSEKTSTLAPSELVAPLTEGDIVDVGEQQADRVAESMHKLLRGKNTEKEAMELGMELAGFESVASLRAERILSTVNAETSMSAEHDAETLAVREMVESARSVVAGVLSARNETVAGRTLEYMRATKKRRFIGKIATATVIAVGVGFASKGLDHVMAGVSAGASVMGAKFALTKAKTFATGLLSSRAKDVQGSVWKKLEEIPVEKLQEFKDACDGLSDDEAEQMYNGLVAKELVAPLEDELSILAFKSHITGEDEAERRGAQKKLAEEMADQTVGFLEEMFDVHNKGERKKTRTAALNAAKGVVSGTLPIGNQVVAAARDSALTVATDTVAKKA